MLKYALLIESNKKPVFSTPPTYQNSCYLRYNLHGKNKSSSLLPLFQPSFFFLIVSKNAKRPFAASPAVRECKVRTTTPVQSTSSFSAIRQHSKREHGSILSTLREKKQRKKNVYTTRKDRKEQRAKSKETKPFQETHSVHKNRNSAYTHALYSKRPWTMKNAWRRGSACTTHDRTTTSISRSDRHGKTNTLPPLSHSSHRNMLLLLQQYCSSHGVPTHPFRKCGTKKKPPNATIDTERSTPILFPSPAREQS